MNRIVKSVAKNSIAEEMGVIPGDVLLGIDGKEVIDAIDYEYKTAQENLLMFFATPDGEEYEAEIEKDAEEDIGIEFSDDGFAKKISCANKCVFCFVDQMPKGMRKTLYFKDDDWRMSFLMGSYVTLTNLKESEINRIIEQKISPLYVSVHATDDTTREGLLVSKNAKHTMDIIRRFAENGILLHTQVVMCEGINDGKVLGKTMDDLYELGALSLAVVPVGLTKFRENLPNLSPISKQCASKTIDLIEAKQKDYFKTNGSRFVFGADELYIIAKRDFPNEEEYENFEQIENGVGMVVKFSQEIKNAVQEYKHKSSLYKSCAVVVGVDFYPYMCEFAQLIEKNFDLKITVYKVENVFFGDTITITGLLTGRDIINKLKGNITEDILFLCENCFKEGCDITLDDISLSEIENELGIKSVKVSANGYRFIEKLVGLN